MGRSRSNCFFFALWLFWRRKGGYLHVRRSRHIWGIHWFWSSRPGERYWLGYAPLEPKELPHAIWHKVWYQGRIVRGDP